MNAVTFHFPDISFVKLIFPFFGHFIISHSLDDWSGEGGLKVRHVLVVLFKVGAGLLSGGHPCAHGHHRGNLCDLSDLADRADLGNRRTLGDLGRGL